MVSEEKIILTDCRPFLQNAGSGLYPLGSGHSVDIEGKTKLVQKDKRGFSNKIKGTYFNSLSDITEKIIDALNSIGVTAVVGNESWVGTFTGALSDAESARMNIDLVKDKMEVTNSQLILNIYKMDKMKKVTYELNAYLS